jgi:nitrite reductase (NO-forming)
MQVRPRLTPILCAGAAAAAIAGLATASPPVSKSSEPAYVLVSAREFRFTPSRRELPAGRVVVQLRNIGEDAHDLVIVDRAGRTIARVPRTQPGDVGERSVRLAPGRYRLVCTVADHAKRGMRSRISATGGVR